MASGEVIQVASGCDGHLGRKNNPDVVEEEDLYTELKVPSVAPTISNCSLLKVDYAVEVHVSGKGQVGETELEKAWRARLSFKSFPFLRCRRRPSSHCP